MFTLIFEPTEYSGAISKKFQSEEDARVYMREHKIRNAYLTKEVKLIQEFDDDEVQEFDDDEDY